MNTNFALEAGLKPGRDTIAMESPDSPYANVLVVREKDKADPRVIKFVAIYQSPATREFIIKKYDNAVVPSF